MARFTLRTWVSFRGSPVLGVTVARRVYSMVERPPLIETGRSPGRRKLKGKVCSPRDFVSSDQSTAGSRPTFQEIDGSL